MPTGMLTPLGTVVVLAIVLCPALVAAGVFADADRLEARLAAHYPVQRLEPQLLERSEIAVVVPGPAPLRDSALPCSTIVVLSSLDSRFALRVPSPLGPLGRSISRVQSEGGLAQLTRCGTRRHELWGTVVEMLSPRGIVERLIVQSAVPLPGAYRYLKSRDPGPIQSEQATPIVVGVRGVEERLAAAKRTFHLEGAAETDRLTLEVGPGGTGEKLLHFGPGCYRLRLFDPAPSESRMPLDGELSWPDGDAPPSLDISQGFDVELRACVVRPTRGRLRFVGMPQTGSLSAVRARWAVPVPLLERWGAEGSAALSLAVHRQQVSGLQGTPVFDSLGVAGTTGLGVEVIPHACYVAAVAPLRGPAIALDLAAKVGTRHVLNSSEAPGEGTALAFCAGWSPTVQMEVRALPRDAVWLLAIWQVDEAAAVAGESQ